MSKIAILSDIHANLHALRAVLAEVDDLGIGEVVFGGDIVGYGADPAGCVALVRERGSACVLGNHDHYLRILAEKGLEILPDGWEENPVWAGIALALEQLDGHARAWVEELPWMHRLEGGILVHASLHDPEQWCYLRDPESAHPTVEILGEKKIGVGFFGHTHRLCVFADPGSHTRMTSLGEDRFVVPKGLACAVTCGSVGQSREEDDRRATWVVWDPEERVVEFRRTEYPAREAAREILAAGLPKVSALRLVSQEEAISMLAELDPGAA